MVIKVKDKKPIVDVKPINVNPLTNIKENQVVQQQGTKQNFFPTTEREQAQMKFEEEQAKKGQPKPSSTLDTPINRSVKIDTSPQPQTPSQAPTQDTKNTKIDFLPDGTINWTRNGQTINFTKEEYETAFFGKGGKLTENVLKARELSPEGQAFAQNKRNQELLALGEQGLLTPQELQVLQSGSNIDYGQAVGAGLSNVLPSAIGGAAGGAAVGAVAGGVGAIPGSIIGGVGGALTSFLTGIRSSIKSQSSDDFAADQTALVKGERYLRALVTDTNQNPNHTPENIALFYKTLDDIDRAHMKTFKDSQKDLNKWLGNDGSEQLAKFEVFNQTMRNYYIAQFETAVLNPDTSKVLLSPEDLE